MDKLDLIAYWQEEELKSMTGWDFSYLDGRIVEQPLPWEYKSLIDKVLKPGHRLLDMGTGGGEFLLSLNHEPRRTTVTEGYPPNIELCRKKLGPLGITVVEALDDLNLDIPSSSMDVVVNRHESYIASEVFRILKPGGFFITQQVGAFNNLEFSNKLLRINRQAVREYMLDYHKREVEKAGFSVSFSNECMTDVTFLDVGALVYFASIIEWEFPGFSVDKVTGELLQMHRQIEAGQKVVSQEHRFVMVAHKPMR